MRRPGSGRWSATGNNLRACPPTPPLPTPPGEGGAPEADDLLAVIAHSLLSSVSLIVGGAELLGAHWRELPESQRTELLGTIRSQARHVAGVLDNLVRLGDPHLVEVLDGLQHHDGGEPAEAVATT